METPSPAPLTPEQLAAINAGEGYGRFVDPNSQIVYHLFQQPEPPSLDEQYVRKKLAEAQSDIDRNAVADWNPDEIKRDHCDSIKGE